jgi:TonB family protein
MTSGLARVVAVTSVVILGSALVAAQTQRLRVGGDITPPKRVVYVEPVYPEQAKADKLSGMVILEVVIGSDGKVLDDKLVRSADPALDEAAAVAVRQWEYTPTYLNGEAVELAMSVNVTFALGSEQPAGGAPPPPPPPPAR